MRQNCSQPITRYNICGLACKGYLHALSPSNLQSAFIKTGIYPYDPLVVDCSNFTPAQVFIQEDSAEETCETEDREHVHEIEPIEKDIDVPVEEIEININNENVSRKPSQKSQKSKSNEKGKQLAKPSKSSKQVKSKRVPKEKITVVDKPCAGTSGLNLRGGPISIDDTMDSDVIEDEEPCCVCKLTGLPKVLST
ncbi:unnamed protein product [Mytilus coruscus]|uniref:Uncharacterized protein n=1 Tax=Mytilus coruscus TaxID=42192 RepID=A0A6J8CJW8_MYTCO|nr:unnamed protein product [Mytilus coruscus]